MITKYLYKFTVPKIEETEVSETKTENGQEIKITRKEKKVVNKNYGIVSPRRSLIEEGDLFYASKISENIKNGILPVSILMKRYDADGGFISEGQLKYQNSLREDMNSTLEKIEQLNLKFKLDDKKTEDFTDEDRAVKDEINFLFEKYYRLQQESMKIQQSLDSLFEQSAEVKARNKSITWWIMNLSNDLNEGEKPFFKGKNYDEKIQNLDDLEESDDKFINYMIKKFSYLISYWYGSKVNKDQQFKDAEENFRVIDGIEDYDNEVKAILEKQKSTILAPAVAPAVAPDSSPTAEATPIVDALETTP